MLTDDVSLLSRADHLTCMNEGKVGHQLMVLVHRFPRKNQPRNVAILFPRQSSHKISNSTCTLSSKGDDLGEINKQACTIVSTFIHD